MYIVIEVPVITRKVYHNLPDRAKAADIVHRIRITLEMYEGIISGEYIFLTTDHTNKHV